MEATTMVVEVVVVAGATDGTQAGWITSITTRTDDPTLQTVTAKRTK